MSEILTHRVDGEGEAVVLLNGGMMTIAGWDPMMATLAAGRRVVRCDFRGQLLSPGHAPAELSAHAADVVALLDALGLPSADLVGASFGALVAVEAAARFPDRVRSLVAVTAALAASEDFDREARVLRRLVAEAAAGGDRQAAIDHLMGNIFSPAFRRRQGEALAARRQASAQLPAAWFEGLDGILAAVIGFDLRPVAQRVAAPALVIGAAGDEVMEPAGVAALAAALDASLEEHPESGHALVVEDAVWLAQRCAAFLTAEEPSGTAAESP